MVDNSKGVMRYDLELH